MKPQTDVQRNQRAEPEQGGRFKFKMLTGVRQANRVGDDGKDMRYEGSQLRIILDCFSGQWW